MSVVLAGCGWVTPLGCGLEEVWARLLAGEVGEAKPLANPESGKVHHYLPVPPKVVEHLGREPRLRRASPISYYAVAAGLAALREAGIDPATARERRVAIVFGVNSGSVLYTRKFYEQIHKGGAASASPALFPETVYNAPASHLAAQLGIDGLTYTLVGDTSIGLTALKFGEQLLLTGAADHCVVAGAEEVDWVLCQGYRDWRFASASSKAVLYQNPARGALLAEGGAAVVLSKSGAGPRLLHVHDGLAFQNRTEAKSVIRSVTAELVARGRPDFVVASASGGPLDCFEAEALTAKASALPVTCPKAAFGEALGAGALLQVIVAAQTLRTGKLPGVSKAGKDAPRQLARETMTAPFKNALIISTGLNHQAGGLILVRS